jgi:hypothetical protein
VKRPKIKRLPIALLALAPLMMGGCPEFRDEAVTAVQSATQGVVVAALDLFFQQFRSN